MQNCNYQMERYVYRRRNDGIYVINLEKTYEKLVMAARVIVAIENPQVWEDQEVLDGLNNLSRGIQGNAPNT